jgi:hypothetical protein
MDETRTNIEGTVSRLRAPSEELRGRVASGWIDRDVSDDEREEILERVLDDIGAQLSSALDEAELEELTSDEEAIAQLAAIDAWTGLISHAVARAYAPASPWPRRPLAGWSANVTRRLQQMAQSLRKPLDYIVARLGAATYVLSVGFPSGITLSITFRPTA